MCDGDLAAELTFPKVMDQDPACVDVRRRADHPAHSGKRQAVEQFGIAGVAVGNRHAFGSPPRQRVWVEIDAGGPSTGDGGRSRCRTAQAEHHDVRLERSRGVPFAIGQAPLEDTKPRASASYSRPEYRIMDVDSVIVITPAP